MSRIQTILDKLFCYNHWSVAWRNLPENAKAYPQPEDHAEFRVVPCEKGFWQADPFLVNDSGRVYLFVEYMPFHSKHACIACREFTGDGFGPARTVLKENVHLSYPQVFLQDGKYYMIPEMLNAHEVCIYEAEEFPWKWKSKKVLAQMDSVDSTVFSGNSRLFLYDPDRKKDACRKLYYAELNAGKGTLSEPVLLRDFPEKLGRPAGNVIDSPEGEQIRPAQDCRKNYGGSLEFREFSVNGGTLRERVVGTLLPGDVKSDLKFRATGLHTWNRCGNIEVIDLFYKRFSVLKPLRALMRKIRKRGDRQ